MRSVIQNGGETHYDAYILHSDLNEKDQQLICHTGCDTISCHFIKVEESIFTGFPESKRYPKQIYYRLAAPVLLPSQLERILYLDVDLVVINPLKELYTTDFDGKYYVACSHVRSLLTKFNQLRLGLDSQVPYINTGVLLMNLEALRRNITFEKIRICAEKKMRTFLLPDQDILTVLYGEKILLADPMRYNLSDRMLRNYNADPRHDKRDLEWVKRNGVIIHYYGKNRPWKDHYKGILDVFYWDAVNSNGMVPLQREDS